MAERAPTATLRSPRRRRRQASARSPSDSALCSTATWPPNAPRSRLTAWGVRPISVFLVHRYRAASIHYLTPTDDNAAQTAGMRELGIFADVQTEIGQIIVGQVDRPRVAELVAVDGTAVWRIG